MLADTNKTRKDLIIVEVSLKTVQKVVECAVQEPEQLSGRSLLPWWNFDGRVGVEAGKERVGGHGESGAFRARDAFCLGDVCRGRRRWSQDRVPDHRH